MCRLHHAEIAQSIWPVAGVQRHPLARVLAQGEQHGGCLAILPGLLHC